MDEEILENQCRICNHLPVCSYKDTYTKILKRTSETYIELPGDKKSEFCSKKIIEFDFVEGVRYVQSWYCCQFLFHDA